MKVKEEEEEEQQQHRQHSSNMSSEATSYDEEEAGLELGLGLSIGGGRPSSDAGKPKTHVANNTAAANTTTLGRILTAKDFPCVVVSSSSRAVSGTKRNADSVSHDGGSSPPRVSQVVGWPPIRASRMYSLVNQAKTPRSEEDQDNNKVVVSDKEALKKNNPTNNVGVVKEQANSLGFVKVNIDGIAIGRKVDLKAHSCYESLAQTLQDMFFRPGLNGSNGDTKEQGTKTSKSKLLDGSSEFVLTYEDKDGDWMLVGDVPWRMFLGTVKRLRIMRTSEATGLAPRFHERNETQRIKPI